MENFVTYLFLGLVVGFFARRWFVFRSIKAKLPEYKAKGAIILDVRSPAEYESGHVAGSINIPLQEITQKDVALDKNKPILVCCASGSRSGMAVMILKSRGYQDVENAGPWNNLL